MQRFHKEVDLLIHDSEYTRGEYEETRGWRHSTYFDALRLAREVNVKTFGLFHHNQNRSNTEQDAIVQRCRSINEENNVNMACFALTQTTTLTL